MSRNGESSPFEGEADDEASGAQLIKGGAEGAVILYEHIAHAEFRLHLHREFEEGQEKVCSCTEIEARISFAQFEDVTVLQTLVHIGLGLHVPAEFSSNEGIGSKISDALRAQLDDKRKVQVYTLCPDIDRLNGSVGVAKAIQESSVLKTQAWDEANADGLVDIQRCQEGEIEP